MLRNGNLYLVQGAWHDNSLLAWSIRTKSWVIRKNATTFTSAKAARKVAHDAHLGVEDTNFHITRY